jgi:hypothetical protein
MKKDFILLKIKTLQCTPSIPNYLKLSIKVT